jgi:hypothetical protein
VIHLWQLQIEKPNQLAKKLNLASDQSERLTGFERLGGILNLFLVQNKVLAKI